LSIIDDVPIDGDDDGGYAWCYEGYRRIIDDRELTNEIAVNN